MILPILLTLLLYSDPIQCRPIDTDASTQEGLSTAGIVAISAVVVIAMVSAAAICTCCGMDMLGSPRREGMSSEAGRWDPPGSEENSPSSVHIEPLPQPGQLTSKLSGSEKSVKPVGYASSVKNGVRTEDWFSPTYSDFPRSKFSYSKTIGNGWFGQVVEGDMGTASGKVSVIVKMLRDDAAAPERNFFLSECNMYRDSKHPNVLQLLGRSLDTDSYLLYFPSYKTDLKSFLLKKRGSCEELIESGQLLQIGCDISNGLSFLNGKGFIHNDVACRNCLIGSNGSVVVGDYGLSPQKFKDDYLVSNNIAVPIRWIAPELIESPNPDGNFTVQDVTAPANVWSFGVTLWELIEFGKLPYMELSSKQVLDSVVREKKNMLRMPMTPIPRRENLHQITNMCCAKNPNERPDMTKVHAMMLYLWKNQAAANDFQSRWETIVDTANQTNMVPLDPKVTGRSLASQGGEQMLFAENSGLSNQSSRFLDSESPAPAEPTPQAQPLWNSSFGNFPASVDPTLASQDPLNSGATIGGTSTDINTGDFDLSEAERAEKREFVLSLTNQELSNLEPENLVEFYEFLSLDEISELERRHLKATQNKISNKSDGLGQKFEEVPLSRNEVQQNITESEAFTKVEAFHAMAAGGPALTKEVVVDTEAIWKAEQEREAIRKAEEEEAMRIAAEQEALVLAREEEAHQNKAHEQAALQKAEEEKEANRKKAEEEEEMRRQQQMEADRIAQEEETRRQQQIEADRIAKEEELRKQQEMEAERIAKEEEANRAAEEEEARKKLVAQEQELKRQAEEEAERQASLMREEEIKRIAEEEARKIEREEALMAEKEAEEALRKEAEEEAIRKEAEEEAKRLEAQRIAEEEERLRQAEEEANRIAADEALRLQAEEEKAAKEAEELAMRLEAERIAEEEAYRLEAERQAAFEAAARKAEEEARIAQEEEARKSLELEAIRKAQEEEETNRKLAEEEEQNRIAEEEAKRKAEEEEEAKRKAEEEEEAKRKPEEEEEAEPEQRKKKLFVKKPKKRQQKEQRNSGSKPKKS